MPIYSIVIKATDIWETSLADDNSVYYNDIFEVYLEYLEDD